MTIHVQRSLDRIMFLLQWAFRHPHKWYYGPHSGWARRQHYHPLTFNIVFSGCPNHEKEWPVILKGLTIGIYSFLGSDSATFKDSSPPDFASDCLVDVEQPLPQSRNMTIIPIQWYHIKNMLLLKCWFRHLNVNAPPDLGSECHIEIQQTLMEVAHWLYHQWYFLQQNLVKSIISPRNRPQMLNL
jgi:hypothetical protein